MTESEKTLETRLIAFQEQVKRSIEQFGAQDDTLNRVTVEYAKKLDLEAMRLWDELKSIFEKTKELKLSDIKGEGDPHPIFELARAFMLELKATRKRVDAVLSTTPGIRETDVRDDELHQYIGWLQNGISNVWGNLQTIDNEQDLEEMKAHVKRWLDMMNA